MTCLDLSFCSESFPKQTCVFESKWCVVKTAHVTVSVSLLYTFTLNLSLSLSDVFSCNLV